MTRDCGPDNKWPNWSNQKTKKVNIWILQNVDTHKVAGLFLSRTIAREMKRIHEEYIGGRYEIVKRTVEI
jgi:hypothetical protein